MPKIRVPRLHHTKKARIEKIRLGKGEHRRPAETPRGRNGLCVMEAVNWLQDRTHTDNPACVAKPIRRFLMGANDSFTHNKRQALLVLIPEVIGTQAVRDHRHAGHTYVEPLINEEFDRRRHDAMNWKAKELGHFSGWPSVNNGWPVHDVIAVARAGIKAVSRKEVAAFAQTIEE